MSYYNCEECKVVVGYSLDNMLEHNYRSYCEKCWNNTGGDAVEADKDMSVLKPARITVASELGQALDAEIRGLRLDDMSKSTLMEKRVYKEFPRIDGKYNPIHGLPVITFARILDRGYTYELTPEEKAQRMYDNFVKLAQQAAKNRDTRSVTLFNARADIVKMVAELFGHEIKGVYVDVEKE